MVMRLFSRRVDGIVARRLLLSSILGLGSLGAGTPVLLATDAQVAADKKNKKEEPQPQEAGAAAKKSPPPKAALKKESLEKSEADGAASAPSLFSQQLAGKLFLGTGFSFARVYEQQDWNAAGMSDLQLAYLFWPLASGSKVLASLRYAAFDVAPTLKQEGESAAFVGVLEQALVGGLWRRSFAAGFELLAGAELGLQVLHLRALSGSSSAKKPARLALTANLLGGCDWQLLERVGIGPRLALGLGEARTLQLGATATFAF